MEKQIHEPSGRARDTSKRSDSVDPLPLGQCGTHTHQETQVKLPSWSSFPPPSLFPLPPPEEHMSPITVLLSQHTIKAKTSDPVTGLYLPSHSCGSI